LLTGQLIAGKNRPSMSSPTMSSPTNSSLDVQTCNFSAPEATALTYLHSSYFFERFWTIYLVKKGKVEASYTRYWALGPELIPVYRQSARRWLKSSTRW